MIPDSWNTFFEVIYSTLYQVSTLYKVSILCEVSTLCGVSTLYEISTIWEVSSLYEVNTLYEVSALCEVSTLCEVNEVKQYLLNIWDHILYESCIHHDLIPTRLLSIFPFTLHELSTMR